MHRPPVRVPGATNASRLASALMAFVVSLAAGVSVPAAARDGPSVRNAEDLLVVDCLLPGQIRQLGRQASFLGARRPIRTTQADCEIRGGEYVAHDRANYQTALKVWLDAAMGGSAQAQNAVGEIYAKGLGIEPDYGMAFQWFRKASEQGDRRAMINLGWLYEEGLGVEQDAAKAVNLYRQGAGIEDPLLYASVVRVELEQRDERIEGLQQDVAREQSAAEALRAEVSTLRARLAERRAALASARTELAETRRKLESAKQSEDPALQRLLENTLAEQEVQLGRQRNLIASLERQVGAGGERVARLELIDPPLVAMRGRPAAVVRGGPGERTITGRVAGAGEVTSVTVNGADVPLSGTGVFQAKLQAVAAGTPVAIRATRADGAVATLAFTLMADRDDPANGAVDGGVPLASLGRYHALVIGNDRYASPDYPALRSAARDATAVARVLEQRYGFETQLLLNASRLEILTTLDALRGTLRENDNLLIYYAGHGELSESGEGHWVPVDGLPERSASWISNRALSDVLDTLPPKRVLVVADSCYSGTMTQTSLPIADASLDAAARGRWLQEATAGRSRLALMSGGVQPVPDTGPSGHSFFARAFLNVLEGNQGLLEATRLFQDVSASLALATLDTSVVQDPQFAPIRFAGHESGTFVLQAKSGGAAGGG